MKKQKENSMKYEKPVIVAQNSSSGSYAAGCPTTKRFPGTGSCASNCASCEIAG